VITIRVPITKLDDERRHVYGFVATAGVEDHQGDIIEPDELESAAHDYLQASREMGAMHEQSGLGTLIESVVLTTEKRAAMGIGDGPVTWFVGYRVDDAATWARVKSGELSEFSLEGDGTRELI
jgi:hypothetical protein